MNLIIPFFKNWTWRMAWRDSRSHRRRLILYMSSIMLGVAALVAISSFRINLEKAVQDQARLLVGADLVLRSRQPYTESAQTLIDSIEGERAEQIKFASMIFFPRSGDTRLIQVRTVRGAFPFYGKLETAPASAADDYQSGPYALVDATLMLQFNAAVGDSVKIGQQMFKIAGRLLNVPGETAVSGFAGPRVYIPYSYLTKTRLLQRGSFAFYETFFRFDDGYDADALVARIEPQLIESQLSYATVASRQERMGRRIDNMYRFLHLTGFIALILGGIGVASAIHVYIKQKLATVAILRCIGANTSQVLAVFLIQAGLMGFLGATVGALLGVLVQFYLPELLQDFLPVTLDLQISWFSVLEGIWSGLGIALLFTLLPLLSIRRVSPLLTLRSSYESANTARDPMRGLIYLVISLGILAFAVHQAGILLGAGFAAGIMAVFGLLSLISWLIVRLTRRFFPTRWPYVWRQGLANLYRPHNQTLVLILSLGLGTFLVMTLFLTRVNLLSDLSISENSERPNMILFDIQADQTGGIAELIRQFDLPLIDQTPIVTMRLTRLQDKPVAHILADENSKIPDWVLTREYRCSYRDTLNSSETLISGKWPPQFSPDDTAIPISIEQEIMGDLQLSPGDTLLFDVQGVSLTTYIQSVREIDWQEFNPNFFVLFPNGVLEEAPQFYLAVTRTPSPEVSAQLQRAIVHDFPNVSIFDLTTLIKTLDGLLEKISFIIKFMALFSVITGLVVLIGAVIISRYQRIRESVLLRTLGASRRQIVQIMLIEYLFLGGFAALSGMILALISSWLLATFVFKTTFLIPLANVSLAFLLVVAMTIITGMINSRGIHNRPPLEVLRAET